MYHIYQHNFIFTLNFIEAKYPYLKINDYELVAEWIFTKRNIKIIQTEYHQHS